MISRRKAIQAIGIIGALPFIPIQDSEYLIWDRRTNNIPVKLIDGYLTKYKNGTLPDKALIRFEDATGNLWGGLKEPLEFYTKEFITDCGNITFISWSPGIRSPGIRNDFLSLSWAQHKISLAKQLGVPHSDGTLITRFTSTNLIKQGSLDSSLPFTRMVIVL